MLAGFINCSIEDSELSGCSRWKLHNSRGDSAKSTTHTNCSPLLSTHIYVFMCFLLTELCGIQLSLCLSCFSCVYVLFILIEKRTCLQTVWQMCNNPVRFGSVYYLFFFYLISDEDPKYLLNFPFCNLFKCSISPVNTKLSRN